MPYVDQFEYFIKRKPEVHYNWLTKVQIAKLTEEFKLNPIWSLKKKKELA